MSQARWLAAGDSWTKTFVRCFLEEGRVLLLHIGGPVKPKMPYQQMVMIDWSGFVLVFQVRCYVFESKGNQWEPPQS